MRIADLVFGDNVCAGYGMQNADDTFSIVYSADALARWKEGKDENLEVVFKCGCRYEVPAFEEAIKEYAKGKAAALREWGTTE